MKIVKLSLALVLFLGLGTSHARAQDRPIDPPLHPGGVDPVEPPYSVTLHTSSMLPLATGGSWRTLNIDLRTGRYTVESGGNRDHMILLQSMGTLSDQQMSAVEKALTKTADANLPSQLPSALVEGAGQFTLSWEDLLHLKNGSVSGVDNPKAAVEGQPADVKALWDAVTPLLNRMSKLEASLVKNHPYHPLLPTVEDPSAKTDAKTAVNEGKDAVMILGKPDPSSDTAGPIGTIKPGESVQIKGTVNNESGSFYEVEVNGRTGYVPVANLKVSSAIAAAPRASDADGVTDAIRNRNRVTDAEGPRTGMGRLIEERLDDVKHPEREAEDGR
jgi:hypothetical protein